MSIRIITDSTSDFTPQQAQQQNIDVVPLKVIFSDAEYRDGLDITLGEFYQRLTTSEVLPTTSQPTPNDFINHFEKAKEAGDDVIVILLSSELSGTFQSAVLAKNYVEYDRIFLVDSLNATIGLKLLINHAITQRNANKQATEIVNELEYLKSKVTIKAVVNTLDYLVKGGRLSKAAGFAGSLLSIKPIISLIDGKIAVIAKARGKKGAMEALWKEIEKDAELDLSKPLLLGYTQDEQPALELQSFLKEKGIEAADLCGIGSVIGTHAGPGASAIAYFRK